eukprot:scaffold128390_cov16-Tisochrysis_lutea.AAC.1
MGFPRWHSQYLLTYMSTQLTSWVISPPLYRSTVSKLAHDLTVPLLTCLPKPVTWLKCRWKHVSACSKHGSKRQQLV